MVHLEIGVSDLDVALKPRWLHLDHGLEVLNSSVWVSFLHLDACKASQVLEVNLVVDLLDATLGEFGHVLIEQVFSKADQDLVLLLAREPGVAVARS